MDRAPYYLGYQLKRTYHAVASAFEEVLTPLGVTLGQVNAMLFVDRFPDAAIGQLSTAAAVTPQALHRTLAGLRHLGLVRRRQKPENEKTYFWSLTPHGDAVLAEAETRIVGVQAGKLETFTSDDVAQLQRLLEKYESLFAGVDDG